MKTIFIATSKPGNARPDYFFSLAKSFANQGDKVYLFLDKNAKTQIDNPNITCFTWPSFRPTAFKDFLYLSKKIKSLQPELLISSFGSVTLMNLAGKIFKVKNRVNFVLSVVELFNENNNNLKLSFLKQRKKSIYQLSTLIVGNSTGTIKGFMDYYKLLNSKILLLPNLITNSQIPYKEKNLRSNQLIIVGNLIKLKGHKELIGQFKNVVVKHPELKLVILGKGEEKDNLVKQVNDLHLNTNIVFKEKVPHSQVGDFFSNALIHISSSYHEAFGFVNIEALREGTPIISTKTEGALGIIDAGVNGEFFDHEDEYSLLKNVDKILGNWSHYSTEGKKSFMNNFSLEEKIESHKNQILANLK